MIKEYLLREPMQAMIYEGENWDYKYRDDDGMPPDEGIDGHDEFYFLDEEYEDFLLSECDLEEGDYIFFLGYSDSPLCMSPNAFKKHFKENEIKGSMLDDYEGINA